MSTIDTINRISDDSPPPIDPARFSERERAYILEHGFKVEGIGTMMNLSDVPNMNTNERKRKLLLADEYLTGGLVREATYSEEAQIMATRLPFHLRRYVPVEPMGVLEVRDFYESLITTGKLRVVDEVELDEDGNCPKCGNFMWMPDDVSGHSMIDNYCGNCGTKIKR